MSLPFAWKMACSQKPSKMKVIKAPTVYVTEPVTQTCHLGLQLKKKKNPNRSDALQALPQLHVAGN
jgi:hypothetical protein